jgi:hypothetical protein
MSLSKPGIDVSADHVFRAFEGDSKVIAVSAVWPNTPSERVALVRQACRPADKILLRAWKLYKLDKDEFVKHVYAVWCVPPLPICQWTFGYMLDYLDKNPTWEVGDKDKWNNVQKLIPEWKKTPTPPGLLKPLIGYQEGHNIVQLEDGNTRMTAAHLAGKFPATVEIYVGTTPTVP